MSIQNKPKQTSYVYGEEYQRSLLEKYQNRSNNHYGIRIKTAFELVNKYTSQSIKGKQKKDIVVLDVGCSIGTFAIEFAKAGFNTFGIDFDGAALTMAQQLAREEGVNPTFIEGDVTEWRSDLPPVDIAVCFDIFEHLHDDELGALFRGLRRCLSKNGTIIFHTYPTQYDYFFFGNYRWLRFPLIPFRKLKNKTFERICKIYSNLFDVLLLTFRGYTFHEFIKEASHCNPTTPERLSDIIKRAGYNIICLKSDQLYPFEINVQKEFPNQPIVHRNIYGVVSVE